MNRSDAYYHISLRPKYWDGEKVEVYIKGDKKKLVAFLADVGDSFYVTVLDVNSVGYILETKVAE
ncbi:hypothetical protein [Shouchella patagoniensis]|uniref:hypothetical protein n=1 Tax=Shouchella patagoniensis TaxID=228576 RepID=UPI00099596A9|nr:hypothetical protein [Shouchella patagoniensis]